MGSYQEENSMYKAFGNHTDTCFSPFLSGARLPPSGLLFFFSVHFFFTSLR